LVCSDDALFHAVRLSVPSANPSNVIRKLGADVAYSKAPITSFRKLHRRRRLAAARKWHLPTRFARDQHFARRARK
jgi:hypothetical protein